VHELPSNKVKRMVNPNASLPLTMTGALDDEADEGKRKGREDLNEALRAVMRTVEQLVAEQNEASVKVRLTDSQEEEIVERAAGRVMEELQAKISKVVDNIKRQREVGRCWRTSGHKPAYLIT